MPPVNNVKVDQALTTMKKVEEYILAGMDTTVDVAVDLVESDCGDTQKIKELKDGMLQYINMQRDLHQFIEAVEAMKSEDIEDLEFVDSVFRSKLGEITGNNDDTQLEQHEKYRDMVQRIWDVQHPDEEMTTVEESQSLESQDVAFTQEELSTKCPYTKLEMTHPMRNKICKHTYDKEGVLQIIQSKGRARCPVGGCANSKPLSMSDMEDNLEMKRFIERKNRQAGKRSKKT